MWLQRASRYSTPTGIDLLEGAAQPDVVQTEGALWRACADVGELGGWHQRTELLLSQYVQLRALWRTAKISQHHQFLLAYRESSKKLVWEEHPCVTASSVSPQRLTSECLLDAGGKMVTPDFICAVVLAVDLS